MLCAPALALVGLLVPIVPPDTPQDEDRTLVVGGREISKNLVDRQLVYVYGRQILDMLKLRVLMEEEIESQLASGVDRAKFEVLDEEVDKKIDETNVTFKEQYPDISFDDVLRSQGHTLDSFRLSIETTLKFYKIFLPENPNDWPAITEEALMGSGNPEFAKQIKEALLKQWEAKKTGDEVPPPNPLLMQMLHQLILKALLKVTLIETPVNGIPDDVCIVINDRPIKTAEVLPMVQPFIKDHEKVQALKWVALVAAVEKDLREAGAYLNDEEYQAKWKEKWGQYEDTPFSPEVIALGFKKFPSMDIYRTFFRLEQSYRKLIDAEIDDKNLQDHANYAKDFLGDGKVDCDVILISAWNFYASAAASPEAFEESRLRAEECWRRLQGGEEFDTLLDEYSGFIEPPDNPNQQTPTMKPRKGRLGPQGKNPLRTFLGESEFNVFLQGYSLADIVFHEMQEGDVIGPLRGANGYYIVRCKRRIPGMKTINLADANRRELVEQDYLAKRFLDWSNEVLAKTDIELR